MSEVKMLPEFKNCPAVFAVKDTYQIMVPVKCPLLFWAEVNGKKYYDHSNGIIRSAVTTHRVTVPMEELDRAGEYTVGYRKVIERKPYFSTNEEPVEMTYKFRPVPRDGAIRMYHVSDTHGHMVEASSAGAWFGEDLDLLILNGDTFDHSGCVENFDIVFDVCERVTRGERTVIFSRGNHDTRGICAELVEDYTPTDHGRSYFTVRLGQLWCIVLDCAEDKPDSHEAYGWTNCCHEFRLEETEFIKDVIKHADEEYNAPGVRYRLVIAHNPFTHKLNPPFDIEEDIYREWTQLLGANVKPQFLLAGHLHQLSINPIGSALDNTFGQICTVIVGSDLLYEKIDGKNHFKGYAGAAVTIDDGKVDCKFTDNNKQILGSGEFDL